MNNKLLLKILALMTSVGAIIVNYLAVTLPLNGRSTADISNSFDAALVPANYVFAIWSLIFLGLVAFPVYQFIRKEEDFSKINLLFIVSNVANATWIYLWHYGYYTWCLVVMLILLGSLIAIYIKLEIGLKPVDKLREVMVNAVFSLYLGWITVATVANAEDTLISWGFDGFGIDKNIWAFLLILVITALTSLFIVRRRDVVYSAVILWALSGVAVRSWETQIVSYTAIAGCIVILGLLAYKTILKKEA